MAGLGVGDTLRSDFGTGETLGADFLTGESSLEFCLDFFPAFGEEDAMDLETDELLVAGLRIGDTLVAGFGTEEVLGPGLADFMDLVAGFNDLVTTFLSLVSAAFLSLVSATKGSVGCFLKLVTGLKDSLTDVIIDIAGSADDFELEDFTGV